MFKNYTECFTEWTQDGDTKVHNIVKEMVSFVAES